MTTYSVYILCMGCYKEYSRPWPLLPEQRRFHCGVALVFAQSVTALRITVSTALNQHRHYPGVRNVCSNNQWGVTVKLNPVEDA